MAEFFLFLWQNQNVMHVQYNLTWQKFDMRICVAYLSDNVTVSRTCSRNAAADSNVEFMSNLIQFIELNLTRQKCDM